MRPYPKIQSVFKRDDKGRFFMGEYARPELEYLADNAWRWTEKVDGTNVRVHITHSGFVGDLFKVEFGGRTDNAQMPTRLLTRLQELFFTDEMQAKLLQNFGRDEDPVNATLYGEGYGAGIQKGGAYRQDVDFILFDVRVGEWWLERPNVEEVGQSLGIDVVPLVFIGTIPAAVSLVRGERESPFLSFWEGAQPEGLVGKPGVGLLNRAGDPIAVKVKVRDFERSIK